MVTWGSNVGSYTLCLAGLSFFGFRLASGHQRIVDDRDVGMLLMFEGFYRVVRLVYHTFSKKEVSERVSTS